MQEAFDLVTVLIPELTQRELLIPILPMVSYHTPKDRLLHMNNPAYVTIRKCHKVLRLPFRHFLG